MNKPICIDKLQEHSIVFGTQSAGEMLKITTDGFYVQGVKVSQNDRESLVVYHAFLAWLHAAHWANNVDRIYTEVSHDLTDVLNARGISCT